MKERVKRKQRSISRNYHKIRSNCQPNLKPKKKCRTKKTKKDKKKMINIDVENVSSNINSNGLLTSRKKHLKMQNKTLQTP